MGSWFHIKAKIFLDTKQNKAVKKVVKLLSYEAYGRFIRHGMKAKQFWVGIVKASPPPLTTLSAFKMKHVKSKENQFCFSALWGLLRAFKFYFFPSAMCNHENSLGRSSSHHSTLGSIFMWNFTVEKVLSPLHFSSKKIVFPLIYSIADKWTK